MCGRVMCTLSPQEILQQTGAKVCFVLVLFGFCLFLTFLFRGGRIKTV